MKDLFRVDLKGMLRGLLFSILGTALIICLFFIAYSLVFNLVTSRPEKVKGILERSSLYTDLPDALYDQVIQKAGDDYSEIPLKDPRIRQIALEVYNSEFVRSSTEKLVDGVYGWLEGKTKQPMVSLDFTEKNKEFAGKIEKYVKKHASKPASITPVDVEKTVSSANNLLSENKFDAKDIKIGGSEPVYESFSDLPVAFARAKTILPALIIFACVLVVIIFYVSKDRISALKRISRLTLLSGIFIALLPIILLSGGRAIFNNLSYSEKAVNIIRTLFEEFVREAGTIYHIMGVLLILIAVGLYIYARRLQKNTGKSSKVKS